MPFSHKHHAGELGIDCRYCHTSVEKSSFAGLPPTQTCMTCHSQIWTNASMLEPVRASYRDDKSIAWTRVNALPDFVYFNHSIHVAKGIGCTTCHGPIAEMPLTWAANTLQMSWCLECHRRAGEICAAEANSVSSRRIEPPANQLELGAKVGEGIQNSKPDELFDVPPMKRRNSRFNDELPTVEPRARESSARRWTWHAVRTPLDWLRRTEDRQVGTAFWQSLEELAETPEYRERFWTTSFRTIRKKIRRGWNRPRRAETDGGVGGAGGVERVHQAADGENRSVREGRRRKLFPGKPLFYATSMPQAERRDRAAGGKQHGPADEDRRESGASRQPGRDGRVRAGLGAGAVRSGSFAGGGARRADQRLGGFSDGDGERASRLSGNEGRRAADSDRDGDFADAGGADARAAGEISRTRNGTSTSRAAAKRARRRAAGVRAAT